MPRITGLCVVNSSETCEFPAQMASNAENVSTSWRHYALWLAAPLVVNLTTSGVANDEKNFLDENLMANYSGIGPYKYHIPE